MKHAKTILAASIMLGLGTAPASAQDTYDTDGATADRDRSTQTTNQSNVRGTAGTDQHAGMDHDPIDADEFVEKASAKGMAEIESGEVALENGSPRIQEYARKMIDDHRDANQKLAELARESGLEVSDEAGLIDRAKTMVLQVRDGESFDEAYINNQIEAHEDSIELFERAASSDHQDISSFATEALPKLRLHLEEALELQRTSLSSR